MAVPDYQSIMLPLLRIAADEKEHRLSEVTEALARQFNLTDQERKELLPSGRQARFDNRVGWASTYMKKAGLLESTGWGRLCITQRGIDILKSNPETLDSHYLKRFPEFTEFQNLSKSDKKHDESDENEPDQTPDEILDSSYQALRADLAQELLDTIKKCSPKFFENLVVDLLVAMGYGGSRSDAGQAVGQSGDGGIDGIIKEDKLGLDAVYVQAKRWEGTVGRPVIQAFAGSLEGHKARKGVVITTSQFSQDAREYIKMIEKKIVLIDGRQLMELLIDYGIGVAEVKSYTIKKIDLGYFGDE